MFTDPLRFQTYVDVTKLSHWAAVNLPPQLPSLPSTSTTKCLFNMNDQEALKSPATQMQHPGL